MTSLKSNSIDVEFLRELASKRAALDDSRAVVAGRCASVEGIVNLDFLVELFSDIAVVDLSLAGFLFRIEGDSKQAHLYLMKALKTFEELEQFASSREVLEVIQNQPVRPRAFDWLIIGVFMTGNKACLKRLQKVMTRFKLEQSVVWPVGQCFLELAFGGLSDVMKKAVERHEARLMLSTNAGAVIVNDNDSIAFPSWLNQRVTEFKNRARMSVYEEHGCTKFGNRTAIDFYGIVLCKLAASRKMKFQVESPYFPQELLNPLV